MIIDQFMGMISLPEEGQHAVREYRMAGKEYEEYKRLAFEDEEAFFRLAGQAEDKERLYLYLYVRMAAERYVEIAGDSEYRKIYIDTCRDLAIWYQQCVKRKKKCGLIEEQWLLQVVKQRIWRLGRLEFEPDGRIIHVHIPEGSPLFPEECSRSFEKAREFFGPGYLYFDCYSWLLSPRLNELLGEESNIIRFQKRFQIYAVYYGHPQAENRIFGFVSEDKSKYPEVSSLQKKAKAYYQKGGDIGMGYGAAGYYEI